jgi:hypothetical protein
MGYLQPEDVMSWIRRDYRNSDVAGPFSDEASAMEYASRQYGLDESLRENAEELNIGDDVIITGPVEFKGKTGVISDFGEMKRFVVVDLYNHGKHSFHSSDVSFNEYADSEEEESDLDRDFYEGMYEFNSEAHINEGIASKIASIALGAMIGLYGTAYAKELIVYQDATTEKLRVAKSIDNIPTNALMKFVVNTENKTVQLITNNNQSKPIQVDSTTVNQTQEKISRRLTSRQALQPSNNNSYSQSQFTIKGIRFGMSAEEVKSKFGAGAFLNNLTIGGIGSWMASWSGAGGTGVLTKLTSTANSEDINLSLDSFTAGFGKPTKFNTFKTQTKGGIQLNVFEAEWRIKDAVITMSNHFDRDNGYIIIESIASFNASQQQHKDQLNKNKTDFEESLATEGMYEFNSEDPYNSEFAPSVGMGRMTLRGWKQSLIRRVKQLSAELETAGQQIDNADLWDRVYAKLKSANLDPVAQEIELAHKELEGIRRKGGTRSRAFKKG